MTCLLMSRVQNSFKDSSVERDAVFRHTFSKSMSSCNVNSVGFRY